MNEQDRRLIIKNIQTHGVHMFGIFDAKPAFTYTIGLTSTYDVELIVFGLNMRLAHYFLTLLIEKGIEEDKVYDDIATLPCVLKRCVDRRIGNYIVQAEEFYGRELKCLQMVLPDKEGYFPWDTRCDQAFASIQPQLWRKLQ